MVSVKEIYKNKKENLDKALLSLEEVINLEYNLIVRDATIQRFEYTFELLWKFIKFYLQYNEGIEVNSPKSCIREAYANKIISEKESKKLMNLVEIRNLTVHTYNQKIAEKSYKIIKKNMKLLRKVFTKLCSGNIDNNGM